MSDLKPGDFIAGEYRVRRVFGGQGKSGMGVVYLVEGRTSEMPFVLKTFQSKRANPSSLARFKAEAETWINIGKHPNIVQCHWVREFSDQLFVAAEYIWPDDAGRNTLTQHLASGGQTLRQQLNWITHFCFGMKHAMAHGMRAHRDIKPDNLMVDNRGRLKITDFGLAKGLSLAEASDSLPADDSGDSHLTVAGSAFGTPHFMSPEQFVDSSAVDHRTDIYSLGIVIYMMISGGKLPIVPARRSGDSFKDWHSAHQQQKIPKLDSPLMGIAEKCLEKEANRRFQSYDEILANVEQACRKHGFPVPHDEQDARAEFERQWGIAMSLVNLDRPEEAIPKLREMEARWPDSSEVYNELARAYKSLGQLEDALLATEKALQLDQYSTADWNNLGGILANLGGLTAAKNAYEKALQIDGENTGAMIGLAQLLLREGELKDAKTWCELAVFWRPEKANVLQVASDCFSQCGEPAKAIPLLDKLLTTNPDDAIAWCKKGNALSELGRHDDAILCFDTGIETAARTQNVWKFRGGSAKGIIGAVPAASVEVRAWNGKGQAFRALGRIREAIASYDKALKIDPQKAAVWCNKGNALHAEDRYADALQCFDKAVALDPKDMKSWCNRGVALKALGRLDEAVKSYDKALELDPRDVKTWFNKANALAAQERYQDALVCFQQAQELGHPDAASSVEQCRRLLGKDEDHFERGFAFYREGNFEKAIRCYDAALAGDAKNPDIFVNKGAALMALGRELEAVACFEKVISLQPENAIAWNNKGRALFGLGRLDEALSAFGKASGLNPSYTNAWFGKGEALMQLGRHQDAVVCFENVVKLNPADVEGWFGKANAFGALGLYRETLACFLEAEKLGNPNAAKGIEQCRRLLAPDAELYFITGSDYQQKGNNVDAIACYEKGLAINPNKVVIWVNKGAALLALKRGAEAVVCFDRAIALDPRAASAWNNKGCALLSLGQQSEGWACLQEAKRLRT